MVPGGRLGGGGAGPLAATPHRRCRRSRKRPKPRPPDRHPAPSEPSPAGLPVARVPRPRSWRVLHALRSARPVRTHPSRCAVRRPQVVAAGSATRPSVPSPTCRHCPAAPDAVVDGCSDDELARLTRRRRTCPGCAAAPTSTASSCRPGGRATSARSWRRRVGAACGVRRVVSHQSAAVAARAAVVGRATRTGARPRRPPRGTAAAAPGASHVAPAPRRRDRPGGRRARHRVPADRRRISPASCRSSPRWSSRTRPWLNGGRRRRCSRECLASMGRCREVAPRRARARLRRRAQRERRREPEPGAAAPAAGWRRPTCRSECPTADGRLVGRCDFGWRRGPDWSASSTGG